MDEKYHLKEENFVKLINDFCIKDDNTLKKSILIINDKLNMKYNKKEYLKNYFSHFYSEEFIQEKIEKYVDIIKEKVDLLNITLNRLGEIVDTEYYLKLASLCRNLLNSNNYQEIRENAHMITRLPNLPKDSDENIQKVKKKLKDILDDIKELTKKDNLDELYQNIMNTKTYVLEIVDIIDKLDDKISEYKHENDLYDFVDISKMAIQIVMENENIKEEIKSYFEEILVDEYQDTSDLQELFLSLVSNHNLYMVGDVKQSIYRFRNANPNIFRTKYNQYTQNMDGLKIDLLNNFRSREEVLSDINAIFDLIMSDDIGGADYIKSHRMYFGNQSYNEEGKTNQNNHMEFYEYPYESELDYKQEEIEAFIIANDIINKVESHYQVFDKDLRILRDITYNDFSILIDRSIAFELYNKIFLYKKIPLSIYKDEYLTNSDLFLVIKNIFRLLDLLQNNANKKEIEYCFLSIGRSFLFDMNDQELFDVIENNQYEETKIFIKIRRILESIQEKTISMILDEVIEEFDLYNKLRAIASLKENLMKIEYLYTLSETLNTMGYNYTDFIMFLNNIFDNQTNISFSANREDGNSVKIMTIHKSKGLEYHICYFPGLNKKFNDSDLKERISFDNELGIITPIFDDGVDSTIYKELDKIQYMNEEISEKIRLFYVALTRAKEKMIFVLPIKEEKEEEYENNLVSNSIRRKYRSFSDIIYSIYSKLEPFCKIIDLNNLKLTKNYNLINSNNLFDNIKGSGETLLMINYPIIEKKERQESHFSKNNLSLINQKQKEMMEFGTKMHYYMEMMDFKNPNFDDIEEEYREKIKMFMRCPLMNNIKEANIYQEYEFIENEEQEDKHGVIDLMLEYDNNIDIIDYKLKHLDDEAYFKQLSGYRDYIYKMTNKPVNLYLYSLIDGIYKKI